MILFTTTQNSDLRGALDDRPAGAPVPGRATEKPALVGVLGICALLCLVSPARGQEVSADPANFVQWSPSGSSQGLKISRRDTDGALTVGNGWSNFQDFLGAPVNASIQSPLFDEPRSPDLAGRSGVGFSIALGESAGQPQAVNDNVESLRELSEGSPNLILSWQGNLAGQGRYQMSAMGRKLDLKGAYNGVRVDEEELGWGLQVAGGWHFSDLFAALRVTLGKGIDSLILNRFGSDVAVSPSGDVETLESVSILPSLTYSINERSGVRLSLGHYESGGGGAVTGVDTLDTINLGYTWSPWPSTRLEVEVADKDFDGNLDEQDSTEIKIGAQTRF